MYESIIIALVIILFSLGFYIKTLHSVNKNMQQSLAFWKNEFELSREHQEQQDKSIVLLNRGIQHDMEC